jgi:hypothetical protein
MSKMAAIDTAVRLQLASDSHTLDYNQAMNALAPAYDANGMQRFLIGVANRLRLDTPAYFFQWDSLDPAACLAQTPFDLLSQIEIKTAEASAEKK